jgi:Helicase
MAVNEDEYTIPLQQLQSDVHLAYAMTINKAQGQTVQHVGLDLDIPVFSHGQLYVALSHCTHPQNVKVLFSNGQQTTKTTKIVWTDVFIRIEI